MEKVAPSERFRSELDEVLAGVGDEHDPIEVVGRLGARLVLQLALEDEVTEFLGRQRYERAEETVSHRNGHESRTTNLLERTFVEVRRRTKVIGRFPGETSALSLIWAVLELSSRGWRGVKMNPKTVAEIERLRRQLHDTKTTTPTTTNTEEVIAA
jgi:transposase-like protein